MWPCWRLVKEGWTTIGELSTTLTREDVLAANDLLDALEEAQAESEEKAMANMPKPPRR